MRNALFIYNPHTAGGKLKTQLLDIVQTFYEGGFQLTMHPTQRVGDAYKWARKHSKTYELLICCGGDGTLNEVVGGMIKRKHPTLLGYIPGGTTNDFATSLGLPKGDMKDAAKRIVESQNIFDCDVGIFEKRSFNYAAGFGAFTDVAYTTNQQFKNTVGYLAYVLEGMSRLTNLPTITAKVTCDGEQLEGEFLFGMVANTLSLGGMPLRTHGKVAMDDGLFELILVRKPKNITEMSNLPQLFVKQELYQSPLMEVRQGKCFSVHSTEAVNWTLDGEFGGNFANAQISVLPKAISICV